MLEKSNTWPEQVLDTLNSCWRALLESLSNTQANVRRWFGANVDFPKYFEKYDSLVRKEKFPEIYHTCVDANDTDA